MCSAVVCVDVPVSGVCLFAACAGAPTRPELLRSPPQEQRLKPPYLVSAAASSTCMRHDMDRVVGN
jgi:hypothetical protein